MWAVWSHVEVGSVWTIGLNLLLSQHWGQWNEPFFFYKVLFTNCIVLHLFFTTSLGVVHFFFSIFCLFVCLFFPFIFISSRLIASQHFSGFCHTLTWISHGFTCVPHPDPPSHLPLYPLPLGVPSSPGPSTCLMHPTWAGDLFHPR